MIMKYRAWAGPMPLIIRLAFFAAVVALLGNAVIVYNNAERLTNSASWVAYTLEVMEKTRSVDNLIRAAEAAKRSYLMIANQPALDDFASAKAAMPKELEALRFLTAENPAQLAHVTDLRAMIEDMLFEMERVMVLARINGRDEALASVDVEQDYINMERIRKLTSEMMRNEEQLLSARRAIASDSVISARISLAVSTLFILALLFGFHTLIQRHILKLRRTEEALATLNLRLEERIDERTRALSSLSRHLFSVREDEKKKIARELHDEFGSNLTAINMDVSMVRDKLAGREGTLAARLERVVQLVSETGAFMQRIVTGLRPSLLDTLGLEPALEAHVDEFSRHAGLDVALHCQGDLSILDDTCRIVIFRLVQEALTNVARHAQANKVVVDIERIGQDIHLKIIDDGIGITDTRDAKAGSFGLLGMAERVAAVNGSLRIAPGLKRGTIVYAVIPCPT